MVKRFIPLIVLIWISSFTSAQSSWLTNNFYSYLADDNIDSYIDKATKIIYNLEGKEKYSSESVLGLFKLLAGKNTNLSAERFSTATNAVGISFSSKKLSEHLYVLSCSIGSQTSYILQNVNKECGYKIHLNASFSEGNASSSSTIQRGIGKNQYANLIRSETKYNYRLIKAEKLESFW